MRSASRLYALQLSLGAAGLAAIAAALWLASSALSLNAPAGAELARACGQWLPALSVGGWLALALLAVGVVGIARGLRSILRDVRASRRYLASLNPGATRRVEGVAVLLIDEHQPLAFCAGFLRPRIYLSEGALLQLDRAELQAVLAHELHHRERRDPLRILVARALAAALFFAPVLRSSSERYAALGELAADEAAIRNTGDRSALAAALLRFSDAAPHPLGPGIAAERVDHLAGEREAAAWRLPRWPVAVSFGTLGALLVLIVAFTQTAGASGVDLPVVLAQSCALAMTLGPPLLAAGLWLRLRDRAASGDPR
jgi:Zn-dependent protease with chaperone function